MSMTSFWLIPVIALGAFLLCFAVVGIIGYLLSSLTDSRPPHVREYEKATGKKWEGDYYGNKPKSK